MLCETCGFNTLPDQRPPSGSRRVVTLTGILHKGLSAWKGREKWNGRQVRIWSGEHQAYWRPKAEGYTDSVERAWVLDFPDAFDRTKHCGPEKRIEFHTV